MTTQKRNDELINLLRADFFARSEPNASWVHYQSAVQSTCGLQGFYPMSSVINTGTIFARDIACGYDLTATNTPTFGYLSTATITALPPWCNFVAATSQYLTFGADDPQHDILGTETYISANERGLTVAGWFKFTTIPASVFGLISKWYTVGDQRAYHLYKNAANNIVFQVSSLGTAVTVFTVTSTGTVAADKWYFLAGRFDPSTTLDVFVDGVKTSNAVAIPAAIFNSDEPFQIGRTDRANYLDGKASMCQVNAAQLSDSIIQAQWEQSRVMYGKEG